MVAFEDIIADLGRKRKLAKRLIRRKLIRFDTIVAVTGSAGKSSTCRLVGAILETRGPVYRQTLANGADSILRSFKPESGVRNWVQEVSGATHDSARRAVEFVRPNIGIVTCVQWDHIANFSTRDKIAEAKRQVVECLPETGHAILNADDKRVAAMARHTKASVVTFGIENKADIRAIDHHASLEEGLRVTATDGTETVEVHTRFINTRWTQSVLAALAFGKALDIPLTVCADAIGKVEPQLFKESVHKLNGITFVLDVRKGALWTIPSCLRTVAEASAKRKIIVLGTFRHVTEDLDDIYRETARAALGVADRVMFSGLEIERVKPLVPEYGGRLSVHESYEDLLQALRDTMQPDDFVYIKSPLQDRLERIWTALNE